jgi:hypothetical protein
MKCCKKGEGLRNEFDVLIIGCEGKARAILESTRNKVDDLSLVGNKIIRQAVILGVSQINLFKSL